jgi:phosphorylcholine metabolism protein LicD
MKFPKVFFDSFNQICLEGLMFNVPANTYEYLDYFYGDWKVVQIEKQDSANKFEVYCEI